MSFFTWATAFWVSVPKAYAAQCSESEKQIVVQRAVETRDTIIESFKERDVEEEVNRFKSYVTQCDLNIARFGFSRGIYDFWIKRGWEAEAAKLKEKAEYYANFRDVSTELGNYRRYALKSGERQSRVTSFFSEQRSKGLTSVRSEQNSCKSVDLRGPKLGPVRDQDSIGWCYAFTTADLISFKTGRRVSATHVAMSFNDEFMSKQNFVDWLLSRDNAINEAELDSGLDYTAAKMMFEKGSACLESSIPSEDIGYGSLYATVRKIDDIYPNHFLPSSGQAVVNPQSCDSQLGTINNLFPNVGLEDLVDVVRQSSAKTFMDNLAKVSCKPVNLPELKVKGEWVDSWGSIELRKGLLKSIDNQLDSGNISSIGFNSNVYFDDEELKSENNHSSIVVGRRFNDQTGQCELLVRNSWGRGCGAYDSDYECEEGSVWIPKSSLAKVLQGVVYVE